MEIIMGFIVIYWFIISLVKIKKKKIIPWIDKEYHKKIYRSAIKEKNKSNDIFKKKNYVRK